MSLGIGRFRPRLVPTLITVPAVLLCLALGLWQMQRLHWKEGLISERQTAFAAPPAAPPRTADQARALEFHRVIDEGVFLNDKEIFLNAIGPNGGAGFDVITPLRESGGRIVFVDRGFIPAELRDPAKRGAGQPGGTVRVSGLVRLAPPTRPGWFLPDNRPDRNFWFWFDLPAMKAAAGLSDAAPFYIEADATPNPGGWPKGKAGPPALVNNHLQYAITWFSLAAVAMTIYFVSQRRAAGAPGGDETGGMSDIRG
jgi:surfeit locus 1 family protein